jgi:pyruvate ferredoxin oxidoreductase delta subunit
MSEKTWREIPIGGVIRKAGNAAEYETGSWRTYKPIWSVDRCIHCLRCWIACPDSAITTEDGKVTGIDYGHCKGCGICSFECPVDPKAIEMKLETEVDAE